MATSPQNGTRSLLTAVACAAALACPTLANAKTIVLTKVTSLFPISGVLTPGVSPSGYSSGALSVTGSSFYGGTINLLGSANLIKTGAGTLTLNGSNTYTGATFLTAGSSLYIGNFDSGSVMWGNPLVFGGANGTALTTPLFLGSTGSSTGAVTGNRAIIVTSNVPAVTGAITFSNFVGGTAMVANAGTVAGTMNLSNATSVLNRSLSVTPVPEPTTAALAAIGLLTLATRRRRR